MLIVTALGNSSYMFAGSALVAAMAWWGCRSTQNVRVRAKLFRVLDCAIFFFVVIATSGLAAQAIKHVVGRARPKVGPSAFSFHPLSLDNGFASLPSGHATSAFAAATALGLMVGRGRGALLVLAAAVGASRVVLRAHYQSDVVIGAALGAMVALGLSRVPRSSASDRMACVDVEGFLDVGQNRADQAVEHAAQIGITGPTRKFRAWRARGRRPGLRASDAEIAARLGGASWKLRSRK